MTAMEKMLLRLHIAALTHDPAEREAAYRAALRRLIEAQPARMSERGPKVSRERMKPKPKPHADEAARRFGHLSKDELLLLLGRQGHYIPDLEGGDEPALREVLRVTLARSAADRYA